MNETGAVVAAYGVGGNGLYGSYSPASGAVCYSFDPQGSLVQHHAGALPSDVGVFDAFGNLLGGTGNFGDPPGPADPVGYCGQWGAYTDGNLRPDSASPIVLMGYRYYDPSTRSFLTRDPISYDGGINLYTYCQGDPVNGADPLGLRDITQQDEARFAKLRRAWDPVKDPAAAAAIELAIRDIKRAIGAVTPGSSDPANLLAVYWAMDQIGDTQWGPHGSKQVGPYTFAWRGAKNNWKCNGLAAGAYGTGAGLGYENGAVPEMLGWRGLHLPSAKEWADEGSDPLGAFRVVRGSMQVGDLVAWKTGHMTIYLGGGDTTGVYFGTSDTTPMARSYGYMVTAEHSPARVARRYDRSTWLPHYNWR